MFSTVILILRTYMSALVQLSLDKWTHYKYLNL
jgi:hypothetical protein